MSPCGRLRPRVSMHHADWRFTLRYAPHAMASVLFFHAAVRPPVRRMHGVPCGHRVEFVSRSIRHLFRITYERSDELTIAALVTYLNAAMPPDKHEDFDTAEVTKAMTALHERGAFVFEGDVIRLPS